jgi:putative addiction module component (TIGR02574 family)
MIQTMPMTVEQIVAESRQLPPEQLAALLDRLTVELHEVPDPAIDQLWADEAERRREEIRSGKVKAVPGEQVMARARKIVGL